MTEYDIGAAFEAIEDELIASMIRNMDRHRAWEDVEGIQWSMWQAEQLKALEKYKRNNKKKYGKQFKNINAQIGELIWQSRKKGNLNQEIQIMKAIQRGYRFPNMPQKLFDLLEEMDGKTFMQKASLLLRRFKGRELTQGTAEFFRLNDRKLEALIKATTDDMERAETAILRKANDEYRKAIYNAQVYANTGAGTYEKAVDMATKDMLSRGLACVEYANGARHTLADYADMAIRTASKRAYLTGEGEKRQEWGIATVIVNKRGNPCPKCLPFCGKVLIDDVWSGGEVYINGKQRNKTPTMGVDKNTGNKYPLMSRAIAAGLYHPRCKDSHTTYFPGISTADDTWTKEELESIGQANKQEAEMQYAERQAEKFERLANYSLDGENQKQYQNKADRWNGQLQQMNEKEKLPYEGIPKTWERLTDTSNIITVNPSGALDNCVNCTIAYEMRKRGFAVVAGETIKKLKREPFSAWKEPDIIRIEKNANALDIIKADMKKWEDGSRAQIAVIWNKKRGTGMADIGHSFIAEHRDGKIVFLDVQTGREYNEDIFSRVTDNEVCYCRIDTLEINDLGSTACRKE